MEVFINKVGKELNFLPEESGGKPQPPNNPPPKKLEDDSYDEEDQSSKDTEPEWEKMKRQYEKKTRTLGVKLLLLLPLTVSL